MTPHTTGALTGALAQLINLNRGELTVLAAAAGALAAAQSGWSAEGPFPPAQAGEPRRGPSHRVSGYCRHNTPVDDSVDRVSDATGTGLGREPIVAPAAPEASGLRLRGRGRLLYCSHEGVDPDLFVSQAYRRRLGPTRPGLLYAAGCDGLLALAERLDEPLYKVGTTEGQTTTSRMTTLAAERYGSIVREGESWHEEDGFDHWRAVGLPLTRQRARMSPVRPALKAIAYECPVSLPHGVLDRAVAAALAPAGLIAFTVSDEGRAACRERAIELASLDRYSPEPLGCVQGRYERARELVLLGPRADADRLACVLEAVIAAHVMRQSSD